MSSGARFRVAVLGAGASGLLAAHYLKAQIPGIELTVHEERERPGGLIDTLVHDGHVFEWGARCLRAKARAGVCFDLVGELGLGPEVAAGGPEQNLRYILRRGRLLQVPAGPFSALFSPFARLLPGALLRDLRHPAGPRQDTSVAEFAERHFGPGARDLIFDPLMSGIYAGDMRTLSFKACLSALAGFEERHGSVLRGALRERPGRLGEGGAKLPPAPRLFSFRGGMRRFIEALAARLGTALRLGSKVTALEPCADGYRVRANGGATEFDAVICALPAPAAAALIRPSNAALAGGLAALPYAPLAVIPVLFPEPVNRYRGAGYLVPSTEGEAILGAQWNTQSFPALSSGKGQGFTIMVGGARGASLLNGGENALQNSALAALRRHLGISAAPSFMACRIIARALPQYHVGHLDTVRRLRALAPPRFHLAGNYLEGVGIGDLALQAKALALQLKDEASLVGARDCSLKGTA